MISNKNKLARSLMKMRRVFPEAYNFFPITYVLPVEYHEFKNQFFRLRSHDKGDTTFIIKPEASCQGKGIFLTKNPLSIEPHEHFVA